MSLFTTNVSAEGAGSFRTSSPQATTAGELVWTTEDPAEIVLATGETLRGLELTYADGTALLPNEDMVWELRVRAETSATVAHADGSVAATRRVVTTTGADVALGMAAVWLRYRFVGGAWSWCLEP